jgi:hypothetical protein
MGYCDHFGLRRFAEDDALGDRLADSLKTGGGTLAVSWLNLGEYANVTSRETRVQVERLLDRTMPAVFPLDVDVGPVSKRELAGQLDPHADRELARLFVRARPSIAAGMPMAMGRPCWLPRKKLTCDTTAMRNCGTSLLAGEVECRRQL